jgi:hypothetical protein
LRDVLYFTGEEVVGMLGTSGTAVKGILPVSTADSEGVPAHPSVNLSDVVLRDGPLLARL